MACCPNGVFLPLINACDATRQLQADESLRVGDIILGGNLITIDKDYEVPQSGIILADATSGEITLTLPPANEGFTIAVKKIDSSSNQVIIDGLSSETIDGGTTHVLTNQHDVVQLVSTSSEWFVLSGQTKGGLVFRGTWDGTNVDYFVGNIVTYQKDAFVCIDDIAADPGQDTPVVDTAFWTRLVNRGTSCTQTGTDPVMAGGNTNTVAANYATVSGGQNNDIGSGCTGAVVAGGEGNDIQTTASYSNIAGGQGNQITNSNYSSIIGGLNNEISSVVLAVAMGENAKPPVYGSFAHANGRFSTNGDAQYIRTVLRRQGTAATTYALFADGATAGRQLFMPTDSCWVFTAHIVGLRSDGSQGAGYVIHGVARRDGAASSVIIGTNTVAHTSEDDASWGAAVAISGTNNLQVQVTQPAITINWVAVVEVCAVEF